MLWSYNNTFCAKRKITTLFNGLFSSGSVFRPCGEYHNTCETFQLCWGQCRVRKLSDFIKNIIICFPKNEWSFHMFGTKWGRVIYDRTVIFGWTIPLAFTFHPFGIEAFPGNQSHDFGIVSAMLYNLSNRDLSYFIENLDSRPSSSWHLHESS